MEVKVTSAPCASATEEVIHPSTYFSLCPGGQYRRYDFIDTNHKDTPCIAPLKQWVQLFKMYPYEDVVEMTRRFIQHKARNRNALPSLPGDTFFYDCDMQTKRIFQSKPIDAEELTNEGEVRRFDLLPGVEKNPTMLLEIGANRLVKLPSKLSSMCQRESKQLASLLAKLSLKNPEHESAMEVINIKGDIYYFDVCKGVVTPKHSDTRSKTPPSANTTNMSPPGVQMGKRCVSVIDLTEDDDDDEDDISVVNEQPTEVVDEISEIEEQQHSNTDSIVVENVDMVDEGEEEVVEEVTEKDVMKVIDGIIPDSDTDSDNISIASTVNDDDNNNSEGSSSESDSAGRFERFIEKHPAIMDIFETAYFAFEKKEEVGKKVQETTQTSSCSNHYNERELYIIIL